MGVTKVLLVDDEPLLLDLERQILERKFGFVIETVQSGDEALKILNEVRFDAIISDYSMPLMDGITLLRKIRERDKLIPFILFTVKEREAVAIEALNSGANFYVQKEETPHVAFTELAHKVTAAVELVRAEEDLRIQRDLALSCANSKNISEILSFCLSGAVDASGLESGAVYLNDERDHLLLRHWSGFSQKYASHPLQAHLLPIFFPLLHTGESTFRDKETIGLYSQILFIEEGITSDAIIPLTHHGKVIGLLHLASHSDTRILPFNQQRSLHGIAIQIAGHISDRLAEDALVESQRKIKAILGNLPGMVYKCEFTEDRMMEFVSEGSEALTGYSPVNLVQDQNPTYTSLIHPDDRPRIMEVIRRAVAKKVQFRLTYRIMTSHMKFRWVWEQGAGVYGAEGEVIGLEGFIVDVTRQKVLDDQVKISQNRLHMLFSNMNAGCAIFHEVEGENRFTLIDMNHAAEVIEGRRKEDIIGLSFSDYFPQVLHEVLNPALDRLMNSGVPQTLSRVPFGTVDDCSWRDLYLSRSHLGHTREVFLIYSDVTDRVRDEEQIMASLHEKELLLKEVHHRVKNNLQIISGILKLQALRTSDPITNEILQDCRNQVFSMASIHELLYSSRDISRINVMEYVANLVNHLKQEYIGAVSEIEYLIDVEPDIVLDIERCIPCGLILNELITNSVKYAFEPGRKGEIRVSFTYKNNLFQMVVADNGRGMPSENEKKGGTSLGTELVNRLVHQLRGGISISGEKGTTITIEFQDDPGGKLSK